MPSPKLKTSVTEERLWVFLDVFDDMKKVNIISLGCSKNLVDTEMLLKQLDQAGYDTETDVENSDAEVVIVNTCGFIGDAKEESVNTILEQVERKKEGICRTSICDRLFITTLWSRTSRRNSRG